MKKSILLIIGFLVVVASVMWVVNKDRLSSSQELENKVGATIFPIYDIAKQIAGDEFEVVLLLPSGASPHTFDPQPSLLKNLQGSKAIFAIGHGLDDWTNTLAQSLDVPVVPVDKNVELRSTPDEHEEHEEVDNHEHEEHEEVDSHEHEESHEHGPLDPHYWLSIHNAEQITLNISEKLSALDKQNSDLYSERAQNYINELKALDTELQNRVATVSGTNIISLHDAWYYFADEFGLNLVGTFEPSAGKEPTPKYLADLQEEVQEHAVSVLFMEPQLSSNSIKAFASDYGLSIAIIDPLGGVEGRQSYIELMRYNVEQVVTALNQ